MCTSFLLGRGTGLYLKPKMVAAPEEAHELVLLVVKSLTERKPKPSEVAAFIQDKCKGTRRYSAAVPFSASHNLRADKFVVVVWVRHGERPEVLQAIEKPASSYVALELWYTNFDQLRLADTEKNEEARKQLTAALCSVGILPSDPRNGPPTPQRLDSQREEKPAMWRRLGYFFGQ